MTRWRADHQCAWHEPHPPECEKRAAEIQARTTGARVVIASGGFVREACAEMYDHCPVLDDATSSEEEK